MKKLHVNLLGKLYIQKCLHHLVIQGALSFFLIKWTIREGPSWMHRAAQRFYFMYALLWHCTRLFSQLCTQGAFSQHWRERGRKKSRRNKRSQKSWQLTRTRPPGHAHKLTCHALKISVIFFFFCTRYQRCECYILQNQMKKKKTKKQVSFFVRGIGCLWT